MDEEEKNRYAECTKCEGCLGWLHHCDAECCKTIQLNIDPQELNAPGRYYFIKPNQKLEFGDIMYYKYHDVGYRAGVLRFKKDRIKVIGNNVYYFYTCSRLKKNRCLDHPDKKPYICRKLNLETANLLGNNFTITPNCLFKYKQREVK